jgi:hypothetical protein
MALNTTVVDDAITSGGLDVQGGWSGPLDKRHVTSVVDDAITSGGLVVQGGWSGPADQNRDHKGHRWLRSQAGHKAASLLNSITHTLTCTHPHACCEVL